MRRNKRLGWFVLLLLGLSQAGHAQEVLPSTLEYWFDGHFGSRQSVATSGTLSQQIDVSALCVGVHSVEMRVSDTKGRWGAPLIRYFVKSGISLEDNHLTNYEYWFDQDRKSTFTGQLTGELTLDLDISQLCEGIHALQLNISDQRGRLSETLLRYFLAFGENPADRQLTGYRYWIDDLANTQQGVTTDGSAVLDIDVSSLCKGIHTLNYQVGDNRGRWSAPRLRYFLVPDLQEGCSKLTAYEYWFNHGVRHRVEADCQTTLTLQDVLIEVKDVTPNRIAEDYVFNVADETVTTPDDVFFGMQVFNGDGLGSLAQLSDTFAMQVPVEPHFQTMVNEEQVTFAAPATGCMKGLKAETAIGDTLMFTLSVQGLSGDFFDDGGNRLKAEKEATNDGTEVYTVEAATPVTYALIYNAPDILAEVTASLSIVQHSAIVGIMEGMTLHVREGQIIVTTSESAPIRVVNASGKMYVDQTIPTGESVFSLSSGLYIVQTQGKKPMKVCVP